jgi:uncharacterized delta-60 repeat protein
MPTRDHTTSSLLRRTLSLLLALSALAATLTGSALAAGGDLDTSFSGNGKATTDFTVNRNDFAGAVAVQTDGKIVVAGRAGRNGGRFALARYNPNGTLDPTFGGNGKVVTNFTGGDDFANGVAIQTDGKIVAVGQAGGRGGRFGLARYNANGTLDSTFNGDGKATVNFTNGFDAARGVALQGDGKIVAAGHTNFDRFALTRLNSNGRLDTVFSGNGKVTTNFSVVTDFANGVVIQANGKIVAAGAAQITEFTGRFALARYNTNGTLDSTFGGNGRVTTDFTAEQDVAFGVALQTNGKIVAAGGGDVAGARFELARYNANGSLDHAFSGDGKATTNFGPGIDAAHGVAIQTNGKIVAAGHANFHRFALVRYNANGTLDSAFGGDGKVTTNFTNKGGFQDDLANGVALQADGKIVAAGRAGGSGGRFAVARYLAS